MSETNETAERPELPQRLKNLLKVTKLLGQDLQIPYRQGRAQRFASGNQIVAEYDNENRIWTLALQVEGTKSSYVRGISGTHIPFGSYGPLEGKIVALPIPGQRNALSAGADILDRIDTALAKPEVAARLQEQLSFPIEKIRETLQSEMVSPMRATAKLSETIFPPGRGPNARERAKLEELAKLGLVSRRDGRFTSRSRPLTPEQAAKALSIIREGTGRSGEPKKSTPALERGLDPKALRSLIQQLPPEPPSRTESPNNPDKRQARAEEKKWRAQRGDSAKESYRGFRSPTPGQKDQLAAQLETLDPVLLAKLVKEFPDLGNIHLFKKNPPTRPETPQVNAVLQALKSAPKAVGSAKVGADSVQAGIGYEQTPSPLKMPTPTASTLGGTELYPARQQPGPLISKGKMTAMLNFLSQLTEKQRKFYNLSTGPEAQEDMARLPTRGTGPGDIAADSLNVNVRGMQPLVKTLSQVGAATAAKSEARDITRATSKLQQGYTRDEEAKVVRKIDDALRALATTDQLSGGLAGASRNKLAAMSPEEKAKTVISLARANTTFGSASDYTRDKNDFVKELQARLKEAHEQAQDPDPRIHRRAQSLIEQAQNRLGITDLSPKMVAEAAKRVYLFDTAARAVIALDNHRRQIEPSERDLTSKRLEPYTTPGGEYVGQMNERGLGTKLALPPSTLNSSSLAELARASIGGAESRATVEADRRSGTGQEVPTSNRKFYKGEWLMRVRGGSSHETTRPARYVPTGGLGSVQPTNLDRLPDRNGNMASIQAEREQANFQARARFNALKEGIADARNQQRAAQIRAEVNAIPLATLLAEKAAPVAATGRPTGAPRRVLPSDLVSSEGINPIALTQLSVRPKLPRARDLLKLRI